MMKNGGIERIYYQTALFLYLDRVEVHDVVFVVCQHLVLLGSHTVFLLVKLFYMQLSSYIILKISFWCGLSYRIGDSVRKAVYKIPR